MTWEAFSGFGCIGCSFCRIVRKLTAVWFYVLRFSQVKRNCRIILCFIHVSFFRFDTVLICSTTVAVSRFAYFVPRVGCSLPVFHVEDTRECSFSVP